MDILTTENLGELLLEYFSIDPQLSQGTGRKDSAGKEIWIKVPNELPSRAGFCSKYNISERRLGEMVGGSEELREVAAVCEAKFKYFVQVNGLQKGSWEQPFASLLAKNEIGYSEKAESVVKNEWVLSDSDRRLLERANLAEVVDVTSARVAETSRLT